MRRFRIALRTIALVMCLTVVLTGFCSCSVAGFIGKNKTSASAVSEEELVRLIVAAVNDSSTIAESFSAIPVTQLGEVSYSNFTEYINILDALIPSDNTVESFRFLTDEEKQEYFTELNDLSGVDVTATYGDMDVAVPLFEDGEDTLCRILISSGDTPSLSYDVIADTVASYNYLSHYLNMVGDDNTAALAGIIAPIYSDEIYIDSVISAKAQGIIEFYDEYIAENIDEAVLCMATPVYVSFEIPETVRDTQDGEVHEVGLVLANDEFSIKDSIPVNPGNDDIALWKDDKEILAIGENITRDEIVAVMGEPMYEVLSSDEETKILLTYRGINIVVNIKEQDGDSWTGTVGSVRMYDSNGYTFGGTVYIGMNLSELLLLYPFIDEDNWVLSFTDEDVTYSLIFEYDENNNVTDIRLR